MVETTSKNRIVIDLTDDELQKVEQLAKIQGISNRDAILRAIRTEDYIQRKRLAGGTILIQEKNNKILRVS